MFDERVLVPEHFPVTEKNRKSTDVCCTIISAIFALTMFITACIVWNEGNHDKLTSLRDGKGNVCDNDKYLSYSNVNDLSKSACVDSCPNDSGVSTTLAGGLCLPKDDAARHKLLDSFDGDSPISFHNFKGALLWCGLIALGVGLIWMTIVHCLPKYAPMIAYVLAIIFLIAIGVLFLVLGGGWWRGGNVLKIVVAVICFLLAILILVMLCMYSSEIKFQGIMLDYAVRFLNENPNTFAYIPIYLLFTAGLFALILWQQACFNSWYNKGLGYGPWVSGVWGVFNILELIWGLQFLRDSFNFCVSGAAVDWYWTRNSSCYAPYQRLVCKHWGSVVGGSFLNAFFEIPTLLAEILICHPQTCCAKMGTICYNSCTCCTCLFDLIRTDAYAYMNISGIPFCDSARQCKKLCDRSRHFVGTHSAMKHYRFVAHVACVTIAFLCSYFVLRYRVWNFNIWQLAFLVIFLYAIITWFVDIHADAAEGLQTSFLAEHELENDYNFMNKVLPSYRKELGFLDGRQKMDANC